MPYFNSAPSLPTSEMGGGFRRNLGSWVAGAPGTPKMSTTSEKLSWVEIVKSAEEYCARRFRLWRHLKAFSKTMPITNGTDGKKQEQTATRIKQNGMILRWILPAVMHQVRGFSMRKKNWGSLKRQSNKKTRRENTTWKDLVADARRITASSGPSRMAERPYPLNGRSRPVPRVALIAPPRFKIDLPLWWRQIKATTYRHDQSGYEVTR